MVNKSMFQKKHIGLGLLLLIIATIASVGQVSALPAYNTTLQSVYGNASCGVCHIDPNGGGNRTTYGMLFESQTIHMTNASAALLAIGAPPAMGPAAGISKLTLILNATMDGGNATVNNFTNVVLLDTTGVTIATATISNNITAQFNLSGINPGDYFIEVNDRAGDHVPTRIASNTSDINQSVGKRLRNSIIGNISDPTYRIKARLGGHPIVNYITGANETGVPFIIVSTNPAKIEVREINTSRELSNFTPAGNHPTGDSFQTWILGSNNHGINYNGTDSKCSGGGCHGNLSKKAPNFSTIATNNGWCYRCHYGNGGDGKGLVDPVQSIVDTVPPTTVLSGVTEGGIYNGNVAVSLTTTDNAGGSGANQTFYMVNGGKTVTYSEPFTVETLGQDNVAYWATDNAANVESQKMVNFTIALPNATPLNFEFTVVPQSITVGPDENATYNLKINNIGNIADTYDLAIDNPSNANVNLAENNISIEAFQSGNIAMTVNSAVTGTYSVNVTATSQANTNSNIAVQTDTIVNATAPTTGGKLSGKIFKDLNKNKVLDDNESGIADMPVTLTGTGKSTKGIHESATTDAEGNYQFLNLKPGRYVIHSRWKSGLVSTTRVTNVVLNLKNGQTVVANFGKTEYVK